MAAFATYTSAPAISAHIRPRSRFPSCTFTQSTPCRMRIFRCVHLNIIFIARLFSCSFRRYLHFATCLLLISVLCSGRLFFLFSVPHTLFLRPPFPHAPLPHHHCNASCRQPQRTNRACRQPENFIRLF